QRNEVELVMPQSVSYGGTAVNARKRDLGAGDCRCAVKVENRTVHRAKRHQPDIESKYLACKINAAGTPAGKPCIRITHLHVHYARGNMIDEIMPIRTSGGIECAIVGNHRNLCGWYGLIVLIGDEPRYRAACNENEILAGHYIRRYVDLGAGCGASGGINRFNRDSDYRNIKEGISSSRVSLHKSEER